MQLIYISAKTCEPDLRDLISKENYFCSIILGIHWNVNRDTPSFAFHEISDLAQNGKPSQRNILKLLSTLYDATEIFQLVIINPKNIFQNICKQYCINL